MNDLLPFIRIGIYAVMAVSLLGALGVVFLKNLFHAALALILTLLGVATLYAVLHAEFLAVVQILLYVGAVMTIVIFAVMLTSRLMDKAAPQGNKLVFPAVFFGTTFAGFLIYVIKKTPWPKAVEAEPLSLFDLGNAFMGRYVFPFEVISIILIAVMIGAIVIAKKDTES